MAEQVKESEYLYAIAGEQTRALIGAMETRRATAMAGLRKIAQDAGGGEVTEEGEFEFKQLPPGWFRYEDSEEIERTATRDQKLIDEIHGHRKNLVSPRAAFNTACRKEMRIPTWYHSFPNYEFEHVGDSLIVRCPPVEVGTERKLDAPFEVQYFVPQDCKPVAYIDYVSMKNAASAPKPPNIKMFSFK
jgi:hypothetical protein